MTFHSCSSNIEGLVLGGQRPPNNGATRSSAPQQRKRSGFNRLRKPPAHPEGSEPAPGKVALGAYHTPGTGDPGTRTPPAPPRRENAPLDERAQGYYRAGQQPRETLDPASPSRKNRYGDHAPLFLCPGTRDPRAGLGRPRGPGQVCGEGWRGSGRRSEESGGGAEWGSRWERRKRWEGAPAGQPEDPGG